VTKGVFISHNAEDDGQFAQQLAGDLQNLGLRAWITPNSIRRGESFPGAINRGLADSSYFLLVVTPAALGSRWVQLETDAAVELETRGRIQVIPLELRRSVMPPLLLTRQIVSFAAGYEHGFRELCKALEITDSMTEGWRRDGTPPELRTRSGSRGHAQDPFVEGALADLARAMAVARFLMIEVGEAPMSILSAVVENTTRLRIGVSVHPDSDLRMSSLLALLNKELAANPHGVSGIFAIQKGNEAEMLHINLTTAPSVM